MTEDTIRKTDSVLRRIRVHPEYSTLVGERVIKGFLAEADGHSVALEAETGEYSTTREVETFKSQAIQNMIRGREYLSRNGLGLTSMACLGNILEPKNHPYKNFRTGASIFGEFAGSEPGGITLEVHDLLQRLEDPSLHAIKKAIEANISLVKIHPYLDGNGRASRLVGNFCLEQEDYPPAIIPASDRGLYIRTLKGALLDRQDHKSSIEEPSERELYFHDFIESKVLSSTEKLEKELKGKRCYDIELTGVKSPAVAVSVKRGLRGSDGRVKQIHVSKPRSRKILMNLSGDIGGAEVEQRLESLAGRLNFRFKVSKGERI